MARHRATAALNYRTVAGQCVCNHTQSCVRPKLSHEEAQRMSQDTGGNPHSMSSQAVPAWPFDIEHRGQGTEDRLHTMADTPDQGLNSYWGLTKCVHKCSGLCLYRSSTASCVGANCYASGQYRSTQVIVSISFKV